MVLNKISSLSFATMGLLMLGLIPQANADVIDNIKQRGEVNFGYFVDQAPYSSEVSGQAAGYVVDLCKNIAADLKAQDGLSGIKVNFIAVKPNQALKQVESGNVDMVCSAFVNTLANRELVSFSIPIAEGGVAAVYNKNADSSLTKVLAGEKAHTGPQWRATVNRGLSNHTYVVDKGTVTEEWVRDKIKNLGVVATVLTADTHQEGVMMVSEGRADAYFADKMELNIAINKLNLSNLVVSDEVYETALIHMPLPRNNDDFRLMIDKSLSHLYKTSNFIKLYSQYFGEPTNEVVKKYHDYFIRD
jgi:polar amino acid transport system substrate-binding protein